MKKFITNKKVLYILGIILFFVLWEVISLIVKDTTMIFPDPISTFKEMFTMLGTSYIYKCLGWSLLRTLEGFVIATLLALIVGVLAGTYKSFQHLLKPTMTALKAIPTACMVFLFLVLIGAKNAPILIVSLISFPILYEAVLGGMNSADVATLDALDLEVGKKSWSSIFHVRLPLATPFLLVGIASSFALSFKIEIMAEIIAGSTKPGLGSAIKYASVNDPSNMVPIFAYSLIAIILILIVSLLASLVKKKSSKEHKKRPY